MLDIDENQSSSSHIVIRSPLPEGITVGENKHGKCLVATKRFEKGSLMYVGSCLFIPESITNYTIVVGEDSYLMNTVNSVKGGPEGHRQVYGFDGYMNHSCDPNIICNRVVETTEKYEMYDSIAIRNIEVGDEIVWDYALFDYTCNGHEIEECGCESEKWRGFMKGFSAMKLEEQVKILHWCDASIVDKFIASNPNLKIVDITNTIPEGVTIQDYGHEDWFLLARRDFAANELIFENFVEKVTDPEQHFIMKFNNVYKLLVRAEHFIARSGFVEFIGFDTFMNHSCDPSTKQEYLSDTKYAVYAKRDIKAGDALTCDYHLLNNQATQEESIMTIEFDCQCGSEICRGQMKA